MGCKNEIYQLALQRHFFLPREFKDTPYEKIKSTMQAFGAGAVYLSPSTSYIASFTNPTTSNTFLFPTSPFPATSATTNVWPRTDLGLTTTKFTSAIARLLPKPEMAAEASREEGEEQPARRSPPWIFLFCPLR